MKSNPNGVGKRWSVGLGVDLTPVPSPSGEGSLSVDGAALFKQVWASPLQGREFLLGLITSSVEVCQTTKAGLGFAGANEL